MQAALTYRAAGYSPAELEQMIRSHPRSFRQQGNARRIHRLYWDTPDLQCLQSYLAGTSDRCQLRMRWVDADCRLEWTMRTENGRLQDHVPLGQVPHDDAMLIQQAFALGMQQLRDRQASLAAWGASPWHPSLYLTFTRRSFRSWDGRLRIHLDQDLRYHHLRADELPSDAAWLGEEALLRLHFPAETAEELPALTGTWPLRPVRGSKYVSGMIAVGSL